MEKYTFIFVPYQILKSAFIHSYTYTHIIITSSDIFMKSKSFVISNDMLLNIV